MGGGEGTLGVDDLAVSSVSHDATLLLELQVISTLNAGETPDAGDVDLLTSRELELGTTESLHSVGDVLLESTDGHDDLSDVNAGDETIGLTEGTTHTGLETIGTGTGQHLVDTQDVEGVGAHTQVETILTAGLHGVLVGANAGSLQGLRGDVLVFARHQVDGEWELVNAGLLTTAIVDTKLSIGDSTAEAGLGIGLVLDKAVAAQQQEESHQIQRQFRCQHNRNSNTSRWVHFGGNTCRRASPPRDFSTSSQHVPASRTSCHLGFYTKLHSIQQTSPKEQHQVRTRPEKTNTLRKMAPCQFQLTNDFLTRYSPQEVGQIRIVNPFQSANQHNHDHEAQHRRRIRYSAPKPTIRLSSGS